MLEARKAERRFWGQGFLWLVEINFFDDDEHVSESERYLDYPSQRSGNRYMGTDIDNAIEKGNII